MFEEAYELWLTNDILLEYEEKITENFSKETAELFIGALTLLPNVKKTEIYYHLQLIDIDKDDNKFSDCAVRAGLCSVPEEYVYSSASFYFNGDWRWDFK